ncbi:MAG: diversity-generating retroelement protein Avd, partial [Limnothrix sp.]
DSSPFSRKPMNELSIIQKTYDLLKWYIPILNRLPKDFRFSLGSRMSNTLYGLLENLLRARFSRNKIELLEALSGEMNILVYQTRLLHDFELISTQRYEFASAQLVELGDELGGWLKQQVRQKQKRETT